MERLRREGCVIMLNEAIMLAEEKATKLNKISKQKLGKTYRQEANYYLEGNNWDFKKSVLEYQEDLNFEVDHI